MAVRDLRRGVLMGAMLLASVGPARAADDMQWQLREDPDGVVLAYEVPNTDDQALMLACTPRQRAISLQYDGDARRLRPGQSAQVELASEGGRLTLPLRAEPQEMDSLMLLVGQAPLTQALVAVLQGRTLRITQAGTTRRIPLAGAQQGVATLVRICGLR